MRLDDLLTELDITEWRGDLSAEVTSVVQDAAAAAPGSLFCCIRGQRADGHEFAAAAVERGAMAILCERFVDVPEAVAQLRVADTRSASGAAASAVLGHPSRSMTVIGITGTNGKTTTAHLITSVLRTAGHETGVIGTLWGGGPGAPPTTPDAPALQARFAELKSGGAEAVVMEVSSHALDQRRVFGTRFACAVFTGLTQDHLDYHRTMEDYFAAKSLLFRPELAERGVVNADDQYGRRLLDSAAIPLTPYSMSDGGDVTVGAVSSEFDWRGERVRLPLGGRFNVSNAIAAATVCELIGVSPKDVARGLAGSGAVRGRFEPVDAGQGFSVIVDYAHTPDGLEQVLGAVREAAAGGRVIAVFGCGGDKDRAKRPLMGAAAARLADIPIVTSDNPRSEDPGAIIEEVVTGAPDARFVIEADRRLAIAEALRLARPGDVVVIAGKGHETTQVIGDRELPFDDREVALELLERMRRAQ
jgi:UDP-N-acetylmuramoyl-L-alanyl-D-glutamate--2,6-diaminopimelate ligase